ncbi:MAG: glycosyltransferase family 4 protein [Bacteroidetes bacterium]|nr:glycosyltransferase family 4 protein [Bacteroidota bacterium]
MDKKKRILFLYTEIPLYFISCVRSLTRNFGAEVHIVQWPVNKEAPYLLNLPPGCKIYDRPDFDSNKLIRLVHDISPSLVYCAGWRDRTYVRVCRRIKGNVPVVIGIDNKWTGSLRQKMATLASRFSIRKWFSYCWVPGSLQEKYARHLGFSDKRILRGLYSADTGLFNAFYNKAKTVKKKKFPRRFIYTGRYYNFKGITDLWHAFTELSEENPNDWELWCIGTGSIKPLVHPKIKHFGFIQPGQMQEVISSTGVFVLPSRFEPWGVALHEFAAAGFPLLSSDEVGANECFLDNSVNGYIFKTGDRMDLKNKLSQMMAKTDNELLLMGEQSLKLSGTLNPDRWAKTLYSVLNS